jgi:hypothetical protein
MNTPRSVARIVSEYLESADAQTPTPNPGYDLAKPCDVKQGRTNKGNGRQDP